MSWKLDSAVLEGYLKAIGAFVGTYGLAVFLVVYYAVRLYPELRQERAEWISEISAIRQIIDPETRPLTRPQAEAVMDIAMNVLLRDVMVSFASRMNTGVMSELNFGSPPEDGDYAEVFDEIFEWSSEANERDFRDSLGRFWQLLDRNIAELQNSLRQSIAESVEGRRQDFYPLSRLTLDQRSLDDVWLEALMGWRGLGPRGRSLMQGFFLREIQDFAEFTDVHPGKNPENENYQLLQRLASSGMEYPMAEILSTMRRELEDRIELTLRREESVQ